MLTNTARATTPTYIKTTAFVGHDTTNANRITFTSVEDLGGGLKFTGRFDQRTNPQGGFRTTGDMFAQVEGGFGTVKVGQYTFASHAGYNAGAANTVSALSTTAQSLSGQVAAYTTPTFAGFSASAAMDLERSENTVGKDGWGLKFNYATGPVTAQLSYTVAPKLATTDVASRVTGLGVIYDLGVAKVYYNQTDTRAGVTGAAAGTTTAIRGTTDNLARKGVALSVAIPVGAATLKAGFMNNKGDTTVTVVDRAMAGVDYALSKRTNLIAEFGQDKQAVTGANRATNSFVGIAHSF